MTRRTRGALAAGSTLALLSFAASMFWYQDWRYSFPTPRPEGLTQPPFGTLMSVAQFLPGATQRDPSRPLLVHFFNPNCPCSQFNLDHIRELTRRYGDRVNFIAVLEEDTTERLADGYRKLGLPFRAVVDSGGAVAQALGVYSTPQAVILDPRGALVFRGNYNSSRYCVDPASQYARIALDALLVHKAQPAMEPAALLAYGCPLPDAGARGRILAQNRGGQ